MQRKTGWICKLAIALTFVGACAKAEDITVFAASSLRDAVGDISMAFERDTGSNVTLVFAASSSIARQVVQGAPADVVLLADSAWADWVVEQGKVETTTPFASNRLVLVATSGAPWADLSGLDAALCDGVLAMAHVDAVPAGRYGKAALVSLNLWDELAPKVVQAANVRAALRFVERGEAPFGIGYASDLVALPHLTEIYAFDESTHPPIQYFGADLTPQGAAFMAYVTGTIAQQRLDHWGFSPVEAVP